MLLDAPFFVNSGERSAGLDTGHLDTFPMKMSRCPSVQMSTLTSRVLSRVRNPSTTLSGIREGGAAGDGEWIMDKVDKTPIVLSIIHPLVDKPVRSFVFPIKKNERTLLFVSRL